MPEAERGFRSGCHNKILRLRGSDNGNSLPRCFEAWSSLIKKIPPSSGFGGESFPGLQIDGHLLAAFSHTVSWCIQERGSFLSIFFSSRHPTGLLDQGPILTTLVFLCCLLQTHPCGQMLCMVGLQLWIWETTILYVKGFERSQRPDSEIFLACGVKPIAFYSYCNRS